MRAGLGEAARDAAADALRAAGHDGDLAGEGAGAGCRGRHAERGASGLLVLQRDGGGDAGRARAGEDGGVALGGDATAVDVLDQPQVAGAEGVRAAVAAGDDQLAAEHRHQLALGRRVPVDERALRPRAEGHRALDRPAAAHAAAHQGRR